MVASLQILRPKLCTCFVSLLMCATESKTEMSLTSYLFCLHFSDIRKGQIYILRSLSIKALTKPNVNTAMNIAIRRREISCCSLRLFVMQLSQVCCHFLSFRPKHNSHLLFLKHSPPGLCIRCKRRVAHPYIKTCKLTVLLGLNFTYLLLYRREDKKLLS